MRRSAEDDTAAVAAQGFEAYRHAVEQHAIVAMTDRRGRITYANDLFCRISGYARGELIGKDHRLISSGHHSKSFWRELWTAIVKGKVWHGEICNRAKGGSLYWVDSTIVPLRNTRGTNDGYLAIRHPITDLKHAHAAQRRLERRDAFKESVLNSLGHAIVGTGPGSVITVFNRGAEQLLGYDAAELVGRCSMAAICDPWDLKSRETELAALRQGTDAFESEWILLRKDGSRIPVHVSITALRARNGSFLGYLGVAHDISAHREAEAAMKESEQKFRSLYQAAPLAIIRSSPEDGRILEANPAFHAMTGYAPADLDSLTLRNLSPPAAGEEDSQLQRALQENGALGPIELEYVRKDCSRLPVLMNSMCSSTADGRRSVWSIAQDITERKQMERQLRLAAQIDKLTGLPNRLQLSEQLTRCIRRSRRTKDHRFAVLYVDLDHFKTINDSLGHTAGDTLLQEIANRLRTTLRSDDLIARSPMHSAARLGGDEFVVLLDNIAHFQHAAAVAFRLISDLSKPFQMLGRHFHVTASIGIVTSDCGDTTAEEYLRDADTAMYEAKRAGRGRYALFDERMRERTRRSLIVQSELRWALQERQFHLVYQPLLCLRTGQLRACEALVRWEHPRLGSIPPSDFITAAEECGLILPLGDWVLDAALAQFVDWRRLYGPHAPAALNVNISRAQLLLGGFCGRVEQLLRRHGLEPERLYLEITETTVMRDSGLARGTIRALQSLGVRLELDDFGTGYSSLSSIHELEIDVIKIDRSFVGSLDADGRVPAVIEAVVQLARRLGIEVVAEGIETSSQLERLQRLGCQLGQGQLFSMPLGAALFEQFFLHGPSVDITPSWAAPVLAEVAS